MSLKIFDASKSVCVIYTHHKHKCGVECLCVVLGLLKAYYYFFIFIAFYRVIIGKDDGYKIKNPNGYDHFKKKGSYHPSKPNVLKILPILQRKKHIKRLLKQFVLNLAKE